MRTIAVEKELSNVADYLSKEGYTVEILSESIDNNTSRLDGYDAIVTSGYNTNMLGYTDTETKVPIINADGLTAEQVKNVIDQRINK